MIKVIGTAYKRDDFTTEDFFRYWRDVHAPLSARAPGLRGYVVSEVVRTLQGEIEADAFVEQWFDDVGGNGASGCLSGGRGRMGGRPEYAKITGTWWVA